MNARMCRLLVVLTAAGVAGVGLSSPARSQSFSGGGLNPGAPVVKPANEVPTTKVTPPPALPGSRIDKTEPAPAERPAAEMSPTDALFDAINRGDITGARDALTRGADLNGRNVLDMTPIDLSVDLGRNDITFLLLSLRNQFGGTQVAGGAPVTDKAGAKGASTRAGAAAGGAATLAAAVPPRRATQVALTATATRAPQPPRAPAGPSDPGTPVPQVGFLGFGGAPASAQP